MKNSPAHPPKTLPWSPAKLALLVGGIAGLAVLLTLGDPGLTIDEPLDVRPGRAYVDILFKTGVHFLDRETIDLVYRDNAEHPPLGRWLLGIASKLGQPFEILLTGNADPLGVYVRSGRLAPAAIFALLVGLIVSRTARRYGNVAAVAAGFALIVMPRVFAHAHLGALDTFIAYFWILALFRAEDAFSVQKSRRAIPVAGLALGLALLTKIHAWFLFPVVLVWSISRIGWKRSLAVYPFWAATGLATFLAGWPWLWHDTIARFRGYLGTGVVRASIQTLYFGTVYADRDVPWHYPWFYFAATVPVGLHLLGVVGLFKSLRTVRADRFPLLLLGSMLLFLSLFSTKIPVYDGERLFLIVFPLWAVFIGLGFATLYENCAGRTSLRIGLGSFLAAQGTGLILLHPFGLSYYNAAVGGLPGAERLGLELTFWGDAVDRDLLDRLLVENPGNAPTALVPTLYPGQGIATTTPAMARRELILADQEGVDNARFLVVSRRSAYWNPKVRERIEGGRKIYVRSRQGVWLSAMYEVAKSSRQGDLRAPFSIVPAPPSQSPPRE